MIYKACNYLVFAAPHTRGNYCWLLLLGEQEGLALPVFTTL